MLTENAQPAIMANAMAVLRVLEREGGVIARQGRFVAGHSLGEYTALCAAGAFTWPTPRGCSSCAGRRCRRRCRSASARWRAARRRHRQGRGAGRGRGRRRSVPVANDNDPGQVVLSGHKGAIERAVALAKDMGSSGR